MQFTINSKSFLTALSAAGRVVPAKSAIQILTNFLVEVKDREVVITASDVDNRASVTVQAETDGQGSFCVEAKFLTNIIKVLPECSVTVSVDDNKEVTIHTDKNTFNTIAQDGNQFPEANFNETAYSEFQLPTDLLFTGLAETSFAVGDDDFHPQMMGILLDIKPDKVVFVATDTRKLVKSVQQIGTGSEANCILSQKAVSIVNALASKSTNVNITIYPTAIEFKGQNFELRCQLIKGNFPPYDRVIPQNNNIKVVFNRADLLGAVRRVSACADSQYSMLRFGFDYNNVVISSRDTALSRSAKETVACDYSLNPMVIGLSAEYLAEILSVTDSENIVFKMSDPSRPVVITPESDDQHLTMLLMPMNVQN